MADQVFAASNNHLPLSIRTGTPGDRGCVSCARRVDYTASGNEVLIVDDRGRYWCLEHAAAALGNVRRRVDERTGYTYPWRFEDVAPDGQCAILTPDECRDARRGLNAAAEAFAMSSTALEALDKVLDRIEPTNLDDHLIQPPSA